MIYMRKLCWCFCFLSNSCDVFEIIWLVRFSFYQIHVRSLRKYGWWCFLEGGESIFCFYFYVSYERIMLVVLFLIKIMWCAWDNLAGGILFLPRKWRKYSSWQLNCLLVIWCIWENYAGVSVSYQNHVMYLR